MLLHATDCWLKPACIIVPPIKEQARITPLFKRKTGIAVIEMHGVIGTAIKELEYSRLLENVRNNRKIGALVLDIDSPGGSASALLYENVRRVAQHKLMIAYVRGLGALRAPGAGPHRPDWLRGRRGRPARPGAGVCSGPVLEWRPAATMETYLIVLIAIVATGGVILLFGSVNQTDQRAGIG